MRTRWLEPLIITLGLTSLGFAGCKGDDEGGAENADEAGDGDGDSSSESAESTTTGDGDTTTGDNDDTTCIPGELGCDCNGGLCLGDLECTNGICSDPDCLPGELACECNDGLCLGDLICMEGVCLEDSGTTTDSETDTTADTDTTTDTGMECPNANELMCDGECIDVQEDRENCGDCGHICPQSVDTYYGGCMDGACKPYWSECWEERDGLDTCNEICAAEGKACAVEGCKGDTWMQTSDPASCQSGLGSGDLTPGSCDDPLPWAQQPGDVIMCCCFQ
jgi:hypothetical protein